MDMDTLVARVRARREAAGLISTDDIACPTPEWKAFRDARHAGRIKGELSKDTIAQLHKLRTIALRSTA